jgi:hypothetical protein
MWAVVRRSVECGGLPSKETEPGAEAQPRMAELVALRTILLNVLFKRPTVRRETAFSRVLGFLITLEKY